MGYTLLIANYQFPSINIKRMTKQKLDPIEARLNRIEGQIRAIKRMYTECGDCVEIVQQIQAARSALSSVSRLVLTGEARKCAEAGDVEKLERVVEKTFKSL